MPREIWTKKCPEALTHLPGTIYIPDDYEICDPCLLRKHGLNDPCYDEARDPLCITPLYKEDDVVKALRLLS
jgi:hypothetical protein